MRMKVEEEGHRILVGPLCDSRNLVGDIDGTYSQDVRRDILE